MSSIITQEDHGDINDSPAQPARLSGDHHGEPLPDLRQCAHGFRFPQHCADCKRNNDADGDGA
jgi:hypothetical protein